jgi:hypothetical protein
VVGIVAEFIHKSSILIVQAGVVVLTYHINLNKPPSLEEIACWIAAFIS